MIERISMNYGHKSFINSMLSEYSDHSAKGGTHCAILQAYQAAIRILAAGMEKKRVESGRKGRVLK